MSRVPVNNARKLLLNQQSHFQKTLFDSVGSGLTGSCVDYTPIYTSSPLSSASLFCSYIRHKIVRKNEDFIQNVRRVMHILTPKHRIWRAINFTQVNKESVRSMMDGLLRRRSVIENYLLCRDSYYSSILSSKILSNYPEIFMNVGQDVKELQFLDAKLQSLSTIYNGLSLNYDRTNVNMYPSNNPSSSSYIKGIDIRIAGPRSGNRAICYRKRIGSTTTRDEPVVYDYGSVQIPTKLGTFGIKMRIVYTNTSRLAHLNTTCDNVTVPEACRAEVGTVVQPGIHVPVSLFGFNRHQLRDTMTWEIEDRLCEKLEHSLGKCMTNIS